MANQIRYNLIFLLSLAVLRADFSLSGPAKVVWAGVEPVATAIPRDFVNFGDSSSLQIRPQYWLILEAPQVILKRDQFKKPLKQVFILQFS